MASGIVERSKREMLTAGSLRAAGALVAAVGVGALAGRWIARPKARASHGTAVEELRKMLQAETKSIREEGERQARDQERRISELDSKTSDIQSKVEGVAVSLRRHVSAAGRKSADIEDSVNRAHSNLEERMRALEDALAEAHASASMAAFKAERAYDTVEGWGDEFAGLRDAFAEDIQRAALAQAELNSLVMGSLLEQDTKVERGIHTAQLTLKEALDARAGFEDRIERLERAVHAIHAINSEDPQLFGASAPLATTLVVALSAVNPKARPAIARKMAEVLIGQAALGAAHEPRPRARPLYTE
jgi:chromosome segregation ATPase